MFRVYISGAITASTKEEELQNVKRAALYANRLAKADLAIYWPHGLWYADQYVVDIGHKPFGVGYMANDLEWLRHCHAIFIVPNSENSAGVAIETKFAIDNSIPIFYDVDKLISYANENNYRTVPVSLDAELSPIYNAKKILCKMQLYSESLIKEFDREQ